MRLSVLAPISAFALSACLHADTTFNSGSISGQNGWGGGGPASSPISPNVVQGLSLTDGNNAPGYLRVSNSTAQGGYNGNFGGWVYSPALSVTVGQSTAGGNPTGAGADSMSISFYFKSQSAVADGSNVEVDFANVGLTDRNNFLAITNDLDTNGGFKIRYRQSNGLSGGFTTITAAATGMSRTDWHHLEMTFTSKPGSDLANLDLINVLLDSTPILTNIYADEGARIAAPVPYLTVNGLLLRSGVGTDPSAFNGSFNNLTAAGIGFDDLVIKAFNDAAPSTIIDQYTTSFDTIVVPEPATWAALAGLGALGLALVRRRR